MASVTIDISMSLDGFIAGPNDSVELPLGAGGERRHNHAPRTAHAAHLDRAG
jgi:hypothetical protein